MSKHFLEDMIRVKNNQKRAPKMVPTGEVFSVADGEKKYPKNRYRFMLWFVALVSATFCFFAFSFLFSRAEISVILKTKDITLDKNLSASLDLNADSLPFELTHFLGETSKTIVLEERDFKEKAKGQIILYNKFSTSSQPLLIDTRLEGSNGKIYKTATKVVIPGMSKNGLPGQISVDIYAAEDGTDYNSAPLDFKIFGFKGTNKYTKFYGRSVGEISGGIVGKSRQLSDLQRTEMEKELKKVLESELFNKISSQIPGFLLYPDATLIKTDDLITGPVAEDGSTVLTLKGTLYGIIFNEQKLTQKIVKDNIEESNASEVYIPNIKDLTFSLSNKENILFENVKNINFDLSGPIKIVWKIDTEKLIADLLAKPKKDFNQVLSLYPNINSALVKLSPPWIQSLPSKTKDIKVTVDYVK